jgi:5'-deoxynucleotidase YfbR-like HD superfamily hydrolase
MPEIKTAAEWLRLSHIGRWAIVLTATRQSVAEHTWRTWALVHLWGPIEGLPEADQWAAERYTMIHDLAEIRTGDMPTTMKTPEAKAAMVEFEHLCVPELDMELSPRAAALVKYADIAESILYLKVAGLGRHAEDVQRLLEGQLLEYLERSPLQNKEALHATFTDTYHDT